jgi:hypothetical protein
MLRTIKETIVAHCVRFTTYGWLTNGEDEHEDISNEPPLVVKVTKSSVAIVVSIFTFVLSVE